MNESLLLSLIAISLLNIVLTLFTYIILTKNMNKLIEINNSLEHISIITKLNYEGLNKLNNLITDKQKNQNVNPPIKKTGIRKSGVFIKHLYESNPNVNQSEEYLNNLWKS